MGKWSVKGKTFYIPSYIHYALPASEKQFTGHLPTGSYISVPEDFIAGIHWINTNRRIDLDLSVIGKSGKIGWDAQYKTIDESILFSGDVTDAPKPNGATELFYFKKRVPEPVILFVNYFNYHPADEVDCKIMVAKDSPINFNKNYMLDVNTILAQANIKISKSQNILGLVISVNEENRMYFAKTSIGTSITSMGNVNATHTRKYFTESMVNSINFRDVLSKAGAVVVDEKPKMTYTDLSPNALNKETLINLIMPV